MSIIKTRDIGEVFRYNKLILQVVENKTCEGCYFCDGCDCLYLRSVTGYCSMSNRIDRKSIIFKRIFE